MKRLNASEVRQNFSECIKEVNEGTPIVVTNRNNSKEDVVIISLKEYELLTSNITEIDSVETIERAAMERYAKYYIKLSALDKRVTEIEKKMNESK